LLFQELSDDLDDYMAALSKTGKGESASKENISKLKQKVNGLRQDLARVEKLIEIARPAKMPDFKPRPTSTTTTAESGKDPKSGKFSEIMVGKRKGGGIATTLRAINPVAKKPDMSSPVKVETSVEGKDSKNVSQVDESVKQSFQDFEEKKKKPVEASTTKKAPITVKMVSKPEVKPVTVKPDEKTVTVKPVAKPVRKLVRLPAKPGDPDDVSEDKEEEDVPMNFDEKEEVWVPPPNQTGDGRTSLNDKFGY
jgi:hypothetical protein